jgi:uncharacterized membrane protein YedE/YeeE
MKNISALISGLIFGLGLGISGMMSPEKVKGFLNITRQWDPSLALVMGGALLVTMISFPIITKKTTPVLDECFYIPSKKKLELSLFLGPALFGIGWGLVGLCPGPAIANLSQFTPQILSFGLIMVVSMTLTDLFKSKIL